MYLHVSIIIIVIIIGHEVVIVPNALMIFFNGMYAYPQRNIHLVARYQAFKGFGR